MTVSQSKSTIYRPHLACLVSRGGEELFPVGAPRDAVDAAGVRRLPVRHLRHQLRVLALVQELEGFKFTILALK